MNKKRIIIGSIIILLLSALFHSVYDKFPNNVTSLFFPVNESIWEHNKMILLAYSILALVEKILKKRKNEVFFQNLMQVIICIIILDVSFTPFYLYILNTKDNLVITILWYFIAIIISFILGEKYFTVDENKKLEQNSLIGFMLISAIFIILTFNPPKLPIFYDYANQKYGVGI